jgi:hypothetical protein
MVEVFEHFDEKKFTKIGTHFACLVLKIITEPKKDKNFRYVEEFKEGFNRR